MRNCNRMQQQANSCGCERSRSSMPDQFPVAMAYVPWQEFKNMYEPDKALSAGTIFPELDLPFWAGRGNCRR